MILLSSSKSQDLLRGLGSVNYIKYIEVHYECQAIINNRFLRSKNKLT